MHAQRSMKAAYTHAMRDRRIVRNQDSHEFTDSSRGERLQRVMADAGVASRRECEALILAGEVVVNGHLVNTLPAWVDFAKDDIRVGGTRLKPSEQHVYIILFKRKKRNKERPDVFKSATEITLATVAKDVSLEAS